ncbi:choice-of-anchor I family protein [Paeniglutamicibacter gangotriensis]|uniref:5'-nucleotidase family protein n=2 Tax=Bacillati TaxID=1783272 RepID=M7NPT3_9MICC|nr:choice-of-anchor I family protein [Paeniglutamicibacter gangotriensis]EMR00544.1 5'-nucleotidase family protein [Paeniglutamicibacter gangotriensis Lz1y]
MSTSRRPVRRLTRASAAIAALAVAGSAFYASSAAASIVPDPITYSAKGAGLELAAVGSYETGTFDESAAEIVTYHAASQRLFVVNAQAGAVDVLDIADPTKPVRLYTISGKGIANSVAVRADGLGTIALESSTKTDAGSLLFFDATSETATPLGSLTVGALPDMVSISADGSYAVVANEGEPSADFKIDPEGSISIVTLPAALAAPAQSAVKTATFHEFEEGGSKKLPAEVRVFGPTPHGDDKPVSRNLEPEYVAIDGTTAYAALQEANAVAEIDLPSATVTAIRSLGFKDHSQAGNGLDASDKDGKIDIRTFEGLKGTYMPDGINAYTSGSTTYLVTANEGDAREFGDYEEGARVKDLVSDGLAPICEDSLAAGLAKDSDLGRLNISTASGLNEAGECYEELVAFGSRSFSIWGTDGKQVFDSGDDFETITAAANPAFFNSNHSESNLEGRSDDKGPEPENLAIGTIGKSTYAFIGLERVGGVMVYDITQPTASTFVTYVNNRDFAQSVEGGGNPAAAGDLGPEGLTFIPAEGSPTGAPMLAVGNEVSGTTTLFAISGDRVPATSPDASPTTDIRILGINDFHGRIEANGAEAGAAVLGGAVKELKEENPNTLLVSAGDNIGASTFTSFSQQDKPTIDALGASGVEVSVVGNHEFDAGFKDLTERVIPRYAKSTGVDGAELALGANVYQKGTKTPALKEYAIREIDGVKVGFIGTVTESTAAMVSPTGIKDIEFGDQLEAANRVAAALSDGNEKNGEADAIVLLTHDGSAVDKCEAIATEKTIYGKLVREASAKINAIISGHTHQAYDCSFPVEGWAAGLERPVIQSHQYGTTFGALDLKLDPETKVIVSLEAELLPLITTNEAEETTANYPVLPSVSKIVEAATKQAEVAGAVEVGKIGADITRGGTEGSDRGVESSLGNLVADMHLWSTSNDSFGGQKADIGIMNPGGLRADLLFGKDGTISYQDAASVQPFGNTLITKDLTGAQLKDILEEQWQPEGSSRPKLHLGISAELSYTYVPEAARGEHITSVLFKGEEVSADQVLRVAANSFLAEGGDNFTTFGHGTNVADSGQIDLVAAVEYFEAHALVEPAPLGRAVVSGTDWAKVDLEASTVKQGETLKAKVSGLGEGALIAAVLHSDPVTASDIPAANAEGETSFEIGIPVDFETGAHTLLVSATGHEDISVQVEVASAADTGPGETPAPSEEPAPSQSPAPQDPEPSETPVAPQGNDGGNEPEAAAPQPNGSLANTGATVGVIAGVGALLAAAGGLLLWRRHRSASTHTK